MTDSRRVDRAPRHLRPPETDAPARPRHSRRRRAPGAAARGRHRRTRFPVSARFLVAGGALALIAVLNWPAAGDPDPIAPPIVVDLAASSGGGPVPPASGAYLGTAVYPEEWTQPGRAAAVRSFEDELGRQLAIVHVYVQWGKPVATPSTLAWLRDGHKLLLSWNTSGIGPIAAGREDEAIASMAEQIKALDEPIFLEPRWEMDRPNLSAQVGSPRAFIAAWDRIRAIFAQHRVDNVSWVWCPTAKGFAPGAAQKYPAQDYYPGDDEVDWICSDPYPLQPWVKGSYDSFADLVQPFLDWAAGHDKPVMIGEFGVPRSYGDRRAEWLRDAAGYIQAHPQIKAVVYYDGPFDRTDPIFDYWLQGDAPAMQAFTQIAHDPYFGGTE